MKPLPPLKWYEHPTHADIDDVRRLVDATRVFAPIEVEVAGDLVEETCVAQEDGYEFLFARDDSGLAGYTCFGEIPLTEGRYDLYWIATHPRLQGIGLGEELLRRSEACIVDAGGKIVYAETSGKESYEPARRFYLKNGYTEVSRVPNFYRKDDDKVTYAKVLAAD